MACNIYKDLTGIIFDSKLSFSNHAKMIKNKTKDLQRAHVTPFKTHYL